MHNGVLIAYSDSSSFTSGYTTHENIAFYDYFWNKSLSYTNIQQISSLGQHFFIFCFTGAPTLISGEMK